MFLWSQIRLDSYVKADINEKQKEDFTRNPNAILLSSQEQSDQRLIYITATLLVLPILLVLLVLCRNQSCCRK